MSSSKSCVLFLCLVLALTIVCQSAHATDVSRDGRALKIDGKRRVLISGSIHYPRSTSQMWPDLIKKAKEGGLDVIETYVFWNIHEPLRRQYNFDGNYDLVRFIKTIQNEGLYSVLRIGPYVCAEWNYGGFPVWLHNMPGIELRTVNDVFMNEMQNFTTVIVNMMKKEKLFASQGGPIILAQIENEYGNVIKSYGDAGKAYVDWCANMATSLKTGVPWIMCQEDDAPESVINTCNGWYCHDFTPNNANSPKMWTENWTGWFKNWGGKNPRRTAEDVAYAVARFFQTGGTFQNYYMYHGGTNFGRTAGGPYITTSYDYDAPLDEFGNLNQPKYGHLKELHNVLKSMENTLTHGDVTKVDFGNSVLATIYSTNETSSCFFSNANTTADTTIIYQGSTYDVPAWSVSILPDCKTEVYNTAKVNTQTNVMVNKPNNADSTPLKWEWRPESIDEAVIQGKGQLGINKLLNQKFTNDVSDYMWYMTSANIGKDDPIWSNNMTIRVNGTGHILHVYVNGQYIGSEWATYGIFNYIFEKNANFKPGTNKIALLSATIGLQNYGARFDEIQDGIPGPVEIIGRKDDESIIKDLSANQWTYRIGLKGLDVDKLYSPELYSPPTIWQSDNLPTAKMMTWYKTTFKAPLGQDPVVVDLLGLGKGHAWVNGNSLGRYWPSFIAEDDGCSMDACDYRGKYSNEKCVWNCGQPTQRWYHVPRSFMNKDVNELVLFEEFGGNPSLVNFQTVVVGKACGNAYENKTMELSCQGRPISAIEFAHFGVATGVCGSFQKGSCGGDKDALSILQNACVGKESCSISATTDIFGSVDCNDDTDSGNTKKLVVQVSC